MKNIVKVGFCILILGSALFPVMGYVTGYKTPNFQSSSFAQFPDFIKDNQLNLTFTTEFDDYFSDQFPFRTFMISAYSGINELFFQQSGNEKVIVGRKGFLFFAETLNDYFKVNTLSDSDLIRLNNTLALQNDYLARLGIVSYFMVAPNKASIYGEYMPTYFKDIGERSNLDQLLSMDLAMPFIDLRTPILAYKAKTDLKLYHLKDSHWNNLGAAVGYEEMLKALGYPSLSLLSQTPTLSVDWKGDLTTMLYPSHVVYDQQYNYALPEEFIFTRAIRDFDDLEIESTNKSRSGNLMMFRDSFANALVPFLSDSFGRVNYSRVFPYDYRKVEKLDPDQVVIEIAERNLNWLLQSTPILVVYPVKRLTKPSSDIISSYTVTQIEASGYSFLNVRYDDQSLGKQITSVRIVCDVGEYDAFPIYQDADFEDDKIEYGFSLYTQNKLDLNEIDVLVEIEGKWLRIVR